MECSHCNLRTYSLIPFLKLVKSVKIIRAALEKSALVQNQSSNANCQNQQRKAAWPFQKAQVYEPICPEGWTDDPFALSCMSIPSNSSNLHRYIPVYIGHVISNIELTAIIIPQRSAANQGQILKFFRLANEIPKTLVNWEKTFQNQRNGVAEKKHRPLCLTNTSAPKMIRVRIDSLTNAWIPWVHSARNRIATTLSREIPQQLVKLLVEKYATNNSIQRNQIFIIFRMDQKLVKFIKNKWKHSSL